MEGTIGIWLSCPECGSGNINQYRMLTGAIWCGDCQYTAPEKEKNNPFVEKAIKAEDKGV